MSEWSEEEVRLLRSHFEDGLTCRQSAERLGKSRQAVQGKRARLGLMGGGPPRALEAAFKAATGWRPTLEPRLAPPEGPPPEILDPEADFSSARRIPELEPRLCRWPLETTFVEGSARTLFCGRPVVAGCRLWCLAHAGRAQDFGREGRGVA